MAIILQTTFFLKCIFLNENFLILNKISLKYVPWGLTDNMATLVQIMSWCRIGDNPLSEAMLVCFTDAYMHHQASVSYYYISLQWHHNKHDGVSNHQPQYCVLNCLFTCRSKKTSKLRVTGLCEGNSPETGKFPAKRASNAENVSIWWRHHVLHMLPTCSDGLTHWGRVTHICIGKWTIFGSDNGLSPGRRQTIIWTNAGIC